MPYFLSMLLLIGLIPTWVSAAEPLLEESRTPPPAVPTTTWSGWYYGAYLDLSYPIDFNFPENQDWRSKATTPRVNRLTPNMALVYVRKDANEESRWGLELGVQGGYDPNRQVPQEIPGRDRPLAGADTLKHFSSANASYLVPIGTGLTRSR